MPLEKTAMKRTGRAERTSASAEKNELSDPRSRTNGSESAAPENCWMQENTRTSQPGAKRSTTRICTEKRTAQRSVQSSPRPMEPSAPSGRQMR